MSGKFTEKKILLIDKTLKNTNDRTWCFWEKENGFFEHLVHYKWNNLFVKNEAENLHLKTNGYVYKMILGIDFYKHCFSLINQQKNITINYGEVTNIDAESGLVKIGENEFIGQQIFSSVLLETPQLNKKQFYLLQHFRGWWIETDGNFFNPSEADLMDFRTPQTNGCTFLYVLPISKRKALIEYTLFSENKLTDEAYNIGLVKFIAEKLQLNNYSIYAIENGVIPMTNIHFPQQKNKVFFIGTAGGQTKASTGYTFQFIQKQTEEIVENLIHLNRPIIKKPPVRFDFYDSVLLRILSEKKVSGAAVFFKMFKKNKATAIFKFLDNETSFWEELKIMASADQSVFIPAALKQLL